MKSKEEEIDELIIGIREISEDIKKKRKLNMIKMEEIRAKEKIAKTKREEKLRLQEKNMELRERLDQAARINKGESNVVPDFKIVPEEIINFLPLTPIEGIKKINENLVELRDILRNQSTIKNDKKERPYVSVKYMGQNLKYIIPNTNEYNFQLLLEDTCGVFSVSHQEYYFKDSTNCVWPLVPPVIDYLNENKKELQLYLTKKNTKNKIKENEFTKKEIQDGSSQTIKQIEKLFERVNNDKKVNIVEPEEIKINKNSLLKANRENEIILMIEKTFGSKMLSLFFYFFFLIYILFFIITKNEVQLPLQLITLLKTEFFSNEFLVNYTIFDFYSKDRSNNYNVNNYSYYQVYSSLNEMQDIRILKLWLQNVYFPKLGFVSGGTYDFMERHKLLGPIRFFQLRQKQDMDCKPFTQESSNYTETQYNYCYGAFSDAAIKFNSITPYLVKDKPYKEKCLDGTNPSAGCALYKYGINYQQNNYPYSYKGQLGNYDMSSGFFFDLSPKNPFNHDDIFEFSNHFANYWIDISTRLITISFNAYQSNSDDNKIFSVTLYIEIGESQLLLKNFDVKVFQLFINFEFIQSFADSNGGNYFKAFFELLNKYFKEFFYLILLSVYSIFSLKNQLDKLIKLKTAIIYKGFIEWVINLFLGSIILSVLILRLIYIFTQISIVNEFKKDNFNQYFPVMYFSENLGNIVQIMEIIMVSCLSLNSLTAFYSEFYEQIFLTIKYSGKYLFSFFMIYIIILLGYAACCTIIYGGIILSKLKFKNKVYK
jgi:hypothetical protein